MTVKKWDMSKAWPHVIKAVVFDCDGVICDSLPIYVEANEHVIGKRYPPELLKETNGRSATEVAKIACEKLQLDMTPEEFLERRNDFLREALAKCPLVPNVDVVIRKLHEMGIPLAVATSSAREIYMLKTRNHRELLSCFKHEVCCDEVQKAKPDPEIFQFAAGKLGKFKPENVLVFEDALQGIKAANAAGMPVVLLDRLPDLNVAALLEHEGAHCNLRITDFGEFDFSLFDWEV